MENSAEEIVRLGELRERKISELAVIRTEVNKLKDQMASHLPDHVYYAKKSRVKQLGNKAAALCLEISMLKSRYKSLSKPVNRGEAPARSDIERRELFRWFYKVAYDVLDPAVFGELKAAALLRAQGEIERKSQAGDGQSFANAQFVR
jgi:hypothetical protein